MSSVPREWRGLRPMVSVFLCSSARFLSAASKQVQIFKQQVRCPNQLHVEAGIQHIRRRHSLVHEAGFRADDLGQVREECNHIVLDLGFDFIDAGNVKLDVTGLVPDGFRGLFGDNAQFSLCVCCMSLDFKPDTEFLFRRPDGGHFRP